MLFVMTFETILHVVLDVKFSSVFIKYFGNKFILTFNLYDLNCDYRRRKNI